MRTKRTKISEVAVVYYCMTLTVNSEILFENRDEVRQHEHGQSE